MSYFFSSSFSRKRKTYCLYASEVVRRRLYYEPLLEIFKQYSFGKLNIFPVYNVCDELTTLGQRAGHQGGGGGRKHEVEKPLRKFFSWKMYKYYKYRVKLHETLSVFLKRSQFFWKSFRSLQFKIDPPRPRPNRWSLFSRRMSVRPSHEN